MDEDVNLPDDTPHDAEPVSVEPNGSRTEPDLRAELEAAEKKALMYQADLENFRRRKNRETAEHLKYACLPLIASLLEVADNLTRALESAQTEQADSSSLHQGVEMVCGQLQTILENYGCVRIEAVGQQFDPNLHDAIQMQPADEEPNTVIFEAQSGYRLHDRVIRPVKVIVSTGPAT
jgi:molecular chaperone GrpE